MIKKEIYCDKCMGTGRLHRKPPTRLADSIVGSLYSHFYGRHLSVHEIQLGSYNLKWRADFISMTESGLIEETEVKISLADFKKDFTKTWKHKTLAARSGYDMDSREGKIMLPNWFSYVVPEELVEKVQPLLPHYAGLYSWKQKKQLIPIVKPPQLHKEKTKETWRNLILSTAAYRIQGYMMKEQWK